jgi:hypothetical protein
MTKTLIKAAEKLEKRLVSERYYEATGGGWKKTDPEMMGHVSYRSDEHRAGGVALLEFGS